MLQDNRFTFASTAVLLMMTFMAPEAASQTPSFDCAAANTNVEQFICADPELASLDVELLQIYRRAAAASDDKDSLKKSQRIWMKQRNACDSVECVGEAYRNRITALSEMVASVTPQQTAPEPPAPTVSDTASQEAVKKAEEDAKRRIEAANKAAEDAEKRAQDLIRQKTEEAEKAQQEALAKAKAEAEQKAKDEALAKRKEAELKLATSIKAGGIDGYGVVLLPFDGKPLCYTAGTEGSGWLGAVGFGEERDWRAEFARRLPSVKDEPAFGMIKDLRKYVSLEDMVSNLHRGDCSLVFGSSTDLKIVISNAEVQKITFEVLPSWFSTAVFEATINDIKRREAEEKRLEEKKAAQLAKDQQLLKEEADKQAAQEKEATEAQAKSPVDSFEIRTFDNRKYRNQYGEAELVSCLNPQVPRNTITTQYAIALEAEEMFIEKYRGMPRALHGDPVIYCIINYRTAPFNITVLSFNFFATADGLAGYYQEPSRPPAREESINHVETLQDVNGNFAVMITANQNFEPYCVRKGTGFVAEGGC